LAQTAWLTARRCALGRTPGGWVAHRIKVADARVIVVAPWVPEGDRGFAARRAVPCKR